MEAGGGLVEHRRIAGLGGIQSEVLQQGPRAEFCEFQVALEGGGSLDLGAVGLAAQRQAPGRELHTGQVQGLGGQVEGQIGQQFQGRAGRG